MKAVVALAAVAAVTSGAHAAPARSGLQYYSRPPMNGQALPFSDAVRAGDVLYLSGQLGVGSDGKLPEGIEAQTKQTLDNIGGILKRAGLGYEDVFHCTAMLSDMKLWPAFNKVYVTYFPEGKRPARSAFAANGLALGGLVELECQAYAGKK